MPRSYKIKVLINLVAWVLLGFVSVTVMFLAAWYSSLLFWPCLLLMWLSFTVLMRGWFIPPMPEAKADDG